jgi:hypothetical protein
MHYANGRAAKVGDLVRGKGYNVKYEIIGLLIFANPGATACNCNVAHVGEQSALIARGWINKETGDVAFQSKQLADGTWQTVPSGVEASIEYGQLDAFVAIDPKTGDVLPPENDAVITVKVSE